jgi:hypothetical protein
MKDTKYFGLLALLIIPLYYGYSYLKKNDIREKVYKHMSSKKIKHMVGGSSSKNKKTKTKKHRKN